jgi:hypothetical protein
MIAAQLTQLDKTAAKALCLQFILHEYARALEIVSTFSSAKLLPILQGIHQLYPDLSEGMPTMKLGILRKLCNYCEALLENSQQGEELLNALEDLQVLVCRVRRRKNSAHTIFEKLQEFFPRLAEHFSDSRQSEAPMYALVELRQRLNKHLGEGSVEQLLQKLFQDPRELRQIIAQGFAQRGFEGFCKQHEVLFEGLAWTPSIMKH